MSAYPLKLRTPAEAPVFEVGMSLVVVSVNRHTGVIEVQQLLKDRKGTYWHDDLLEQAEKHAVKEKKP